MPVVNITIKPVSPPVASSSSSQNTPTSPRSVSPSRVVQEAPKVQVNIAVGNYETLLYLQESQIKSLVNISAILLTIEALLAGANVLEAERRGWGSHAWQIHIDLPGALYGQKWLIAGNENARQALLTELPDVKEVRQLVIHDRAEIYTPDLDSLPAPFSSPIANTLTSLQLWVSAHAQAMLNSLNLTLSNKALSQLNRLALLVAENEQACSYIDGQVQLKQEWAKIPEALRLLYKEGFKHLPESLKHLSVLFLLAPSTQAGLKQFNKGKHLSQLETLKITVEQSTMQLQSKRGRAASSSTKTAVLPRSGSGVLVDKGASSSPIKTSSAVPLTLQDMLKTSLPQLRQFEVYDNSLNIYSSKVGEVPLFSPMSQLDLLTEAIKARHLQGPLDIVIGSPTLSFYENLENKNIEWDKIDVRPIDADNLLETIKNEKPSIANLLFFAIEETRYKNWFAYIVEKGAENVFRGVQTIYYRVPPVYNSCGELDDNVNINNHALTNLLKALQLGYLPLLKSVIIDDPAQRANSELIAQIETYMQYIKNRDQQTVTTIKAHIRTNVDVPDGKVR